VPLRPWACLKHIFQQSGAGGMPQWFLLVDSRLQRATHVTKHRIDGTAMLKNFFLVDQFNGRVRSKVTSNWPFSSWSMASWVCCSSSLSSMLPVIVVLRFTDSTSVTSVEDIWDNRATSASLERNMDFNKIDE
jgi:hypothetical protein